jgi:recombination protein RecA
MSITPEKLKQIDALKTSIDKKYGQDSIQILGQGNEVSNMVRVSSGIASLDSAIGGGWPRGRIIEIYGPESSGKTTATLEAIAEAQKLGHICAIIDVEHALDLAYASNLGVNVEDLILSQPDTAEEALDIVEMLVSSGVVQLVVVDSVAALVPQAELDGVMSDNQVGLQARLMSKAMRKLAGVLNKSSCTVIFINQLREKVGIAYGNPEVTSGGRALKFYASVRIDIRRSEAIKAGDTMIGNIVKIKVVKNKVAPPFMIAEIELLFGQGFSKTGEILDKATDLGMIKKMGSWYELEGTRLGQGRETAKDYLKAHPEVMEKLEKRIKTGEI